MYTDADITCVPMDVASSALNAVLGGHIDITFLELGLAYKHLQAGSLRALAVMDNKRVKAFPDIPTTVERGFPNMIVGGFQVFLVRSETPRVIVEKLENVFKETLKDKEIIEKFKKIGWIVENLGLKEATELLAKEMQRCTELAKAAKMVPQ